MPSPKIFPAAAALSMALCWSSPTYAQLDRDSVVRAMPSWSTGALTVHLGAARLGVDGLNETLIASGRPAVSATVSTIGLSGEARFGRLIVGGSGVSTFPQRKVSDGWINTAAFGSAMLDVGVALFERTHLSVSPRASLGVQRTTLQVVQAGDFTFESGVSQPARGVTVSSLRGVASLSASAQLQLDTRWSGAFAIGLQVGYTSPVGVAMTRSGESKVTGVPQESSGHYVRLIVGRPIRRRSEAAQSLSAIVLPFLAR